jgi:tRNA(Met) C34 N-acetyltransferase TmcA
MLVLEYYSFSLTGRNFFAGDLIPWTMAQQFQDDNFPQLSGARIVRYENRKITCQE